MRINCKFSLKTLLVLMSVFCVCVWLVVEYHTGAPRRRVINKLERTGGLVFYNYEVDRLGQNWELNELAPFGHGVVKRDPTFVRTMLGEEVFHHVVYVVLIFKTSAYVEDIKQLRVFPDLQYLEVYGKFDEDVAEEIGAIPKLQRIRIYNDPGEKIIQTIKFENPNLMVYIG